MTQPVNQKADLARRLTTAMIDAALDLPDFAEAPTVLGTAMAEALDYMTGKLGPEVPSCFLARCKALQDAQQEKNHEAGHG